MIAFDLPPFRLSPGASAVLLIWRKMSGPIKYVPGTEYSQKELEEIDRRIGERIERIERMKKIGRTLNDIVRAARLRKPDKDGVLTHVFRPRETPPEVWLPLRQTGMLHTGKE